MSFTEFDFVEGDTGGQFVVVGGPLVQLRHMLAKGEVDPAVRIYEETSALARDGLLSEAESASYDTRKAIAQLFQRSRDFAAAGKVFRLAKLEGEAASAFEQAGEFAEAAASWAKAGEALKAAAAYERAGRTDAALELYRAAGQSDRVAECLARAQRFLEASQEFRKLGNTHAEVEVLRSGVTAEPANVELVTRLAELMLQHGAADRAAQLLMETTRRVPAAKDESRFLTLLAASLDAVGNGSAAEKVRARLRAMPQKAPAQPSAKPTDARSELGGDAYAFLKALPMFAGLSMADMQALYRVCTLHAFAPGQHLIEPGQPGRGLYLIVQGQVEVFATSATDSRLLNTLGVGGYVGEISLVQDGPTSARVTARGPVKVLFISREAFREYVFNSPTAALRIYQLFTHNLAERVRVLSASR